MSDTTRSTAEKLAAAKKKHKAYLKEKSLKNNVATIKDSPQEEPTPFIQNPVELNPGNVTSETLVEEKTEIAHFDRQAEQENPYEESFPLPQYTTGYSDNNHSSTLPDPLSFFDNFSNVTLQNFTQPLANFFNGSNHSTSQFENVEDTPNQILVEENHLKLSQDQTLPYPKNVQNIFSYNKFKSDAIKNVSKDDIITETILDSHDMFEEFTNSTNEKTETFHNSAAPQFNSNGKFQENAFLIDTKEEIKINENKPVMFEIQPTLEVETQQPLQEAIQFTSVDSLFPSSYQNNSDELEKKNRELQSLLDQQNLRYVQLNTRLEESELKYSKLYNDYITLETEKEQIETSLNSKLNGETEHELQKLKEDFQCHIQTINMLVAEKTELSSQLNQAESMLKNESSQISELKIQLKEMKRQNNDLENKMETLKSETLSTNTSQKEQEDAYNQLRDRNKSLQNQCEELQQDSLELKEKLRSAIENNAELQKQVHELTNQLSMANLRIHQLTLGETGPQHENEIEKLNQEKSALEKQINLLNESFKTISKERDESNIQYQQYVAQLNSQISNLGMQLQHIQMENEQLKIQEEHRIKHIGALEKQLQHKQNNEVSADLQSNNESLRNELKSSMDLIRNLQIEKNDLETNLTKTLVDKELLEKELETLKFSIGEMETMIEQLKGNQPDNAILLATMESDKVAASRAISQNNELKKQMEGMHEVLIKVNNDNVQLTESISFEQKTNRELMEKLQKTEIAYQTLAEAIEIKDRELVNLRDQLETMNNHLMQHEQITDRMRHYESQEHSLLFLQKELQEAKHTIAHLTNEINSRHENSTPNQAENIDQEPIDHSVEELQIQLNNLQIRNNELEHLLKNSNTLEMKNTDTNGNESLDKDTAMKHLERKFLKTMDEMAKLSEEKQRLEHLVLQLQGETETIGEYVTLYQQQRSILKQRALEKDHQLQQLTNDREIIKANLDRLNNLVNKLIIEKGAITKELLDQHKQFSEKRTDLCEEHQKIHQEINRITGDSLKNTITHDNPNTEIAEEIITLLSEIKTSNLVQPNEGIHHCPWCSGKMITV